MEIVSSSKMVGNIIVLGYLNKALIPIYIYFKTVQPEKTQLNVFVFTGVNLNVTLSKLNHIRIFK